jgi:hypothetical protein
LTGEREGGGAERGEDGGDGAEQSQIQRGGLARYRRRLAGQLELEEKRRRPWWRHPAFLLGVGVAIVVAASVASDFPVSASHSDTVASVRSFVQEIETDVGPCSYAMGESWQLYQADISGSATATERGEIPRLLNDDLDTCSYLEDDIVDLAGIAIPGAPVGINLRALSNAALAWVDPDALGAITDIFTLVTSPGSPSSLKDLPRREAALVKDRATALQLLAGASLSLHAPLPALSLWEPPGHTSG